MKVCNQVFVLNIMCHRLHLHNQLNHATFQRPFIFTANELMTQQRERFREQYVFQLNIYDYISVFYASSPPHEGILNRWGV